jgi:HD superfamily phosphohydrolase
VALNPDRRYEIRCPVHGFISLDGWEKSIIDHPVFQRLRRIRQLAWTDMLYPGAMHTRFEHSLGAMHTATLLYDAIAARSAEALKHEFGYEKASLERDRRLVRFAALLHDVGHTPFSHAAEDLFPNDDHGVRYEHEHYSAAVVRNELKDVIENHELNALDLEAEDVAALLEGSSKTARKVFWREIIDGQMDADRMDYLLRDSHHLGVQYGRFDLHRLVNTVVAIPTVMDKGHQAATEENQAGETVQTPPEDMRTTLKLGITEGGWHAAEALVLARYFMFTQVYFHKTRVAYDIHLREALKQLLPGSRFPRPVNEELKEFLEWDDWRVLGLLSEGKGGEHAQILRQRDHYREVFHTAEVTSVEENQRLQWAKNALGDLLVAEEHASKSWYKTGSPDIPVIRKSGKARVSSLSEFSNPIKNLKANNQILLYVKSSDKETAEKRLREAEAT